MRFAIRRPTVRPSATICLALAGLLWAGAAQAWTLNIAAASRRVFLHVGNGTYDANNAFVNLVQVSLSGAQLLSGTPQPMTSPNNTQTQSLLDGFGTCTNSATQILIGASYRRSNGGDGPAQATLSVSSPASLTTVAGDSIPFSQISWTVSQQGTNTPNVIPAGTFAGATQTLASVAANTYIENCHTFTYANSAVRAAGTYNGRVTYTMSAP